MVKVTDGQAQIQQTSSEMFNVIRQAQQTQNDTAQAVIKMSLEEKISQQKQIVAENVIDLYL